MGNSESKENKTQNEPNTEVAKKAAPKKDDKPAKKKGFFSNMKAEFKRIVWPDKDTVVKESTAVVVVTLILGIIIALLDWAIKLGLDKIIQIG